MLDTPRGNRLHIALFGRRNAGKSSLINALTNQELAVVSSIPGTTTDPVFKSMEILPLGPVVLIDTAGIDDIGELGALRIKKTLEVLRKTDLAILVLDPGYGVGDYELELKARLAEARIPVVAVLNKIDVAGRANLAELEQSLGQKVLPVSAKTRQGIEELKRELIKAAPADFEAPYLVGDLVEPGDLAVLVVPIDTAAPKGRLILPQVQVLRDLLDNDAMGLVVKERELKAALAKIPRPKIVITDSQAFLKVAADTPREVWMTSFSILMARYKGDLLELVRGAKAIKHLKPGDRVLIAEACTHHRQPDDIGKVQIPRWLRQYVGGELNFQWVSGGSFPEDLSPYQLIIHCGGCMITRREMLYRIQAAKAAGVPIVNYGIFLAYVHGILDRALEPFPLAKMEWEEDS
ncbi:iron-only hydrogenase maturation protein HydF [Thermanaeromonas toyohensis ToBE]|uniref:Iron-only hydrogenase maturation protein HydF n=1 Tax=Thermanaeromonas toyohensis ToBE TaxID=698762 RepID=A0A1W1VYI7_9FIRM|nr:[FeFe] hydrogenase H-cluster maturation GTPase HydF [Thermanaeromonas toyohensis]SMB98161.1 iron-only hydrogenase maturation protein HydF [Thermanaeromonas toyohensis ToBE]